MKKQLLIITPSNSKKITYTVNIHLRLIDYCLVLIKNKFVFSSVLIFISISLFAQKNEEKGITKETEKTTLEQSPESRIDIRNDNFPINLSKKASCGVYERLIDASELSPSINLTATDENLQIRGSKSASNGVFEYLRNNPEGHDETSNIMLKGNPMGVREMINFQSGRALLKENDLSITVRGSIENQAGEPLIGAHIIAYTEGRLVVATVSSLLGDFELTSKATEIEVSYLGYQPIRESIQYFLDKPVIVLMEGVNLPEVVVTAYNSRRSEIGCILWGWGHGPSDVILEDSINLNIAFTPTTWQVYPNPTADKITIKTVFTQGVFMLISAQGQVLKTIPIQDQHTQVNLNEYPAGNYYLRYESDAWSETFGPVLKIKR